MTALVDKVFAEEDPNSAHPEDALHWIAVYHGLLSILESAGAATARAAGASKRSATDHDLLRAQAELYVARLRFWVERAKLLASLP
ncbi:MAG: hypothetical protein JOY68_00630 [Candidatus Dormibacteraeota bacterium]|nr:hypothetical protein [Candidatus Dormibacteraeota bacterium]